MSDKPADVGDLIARALDANPLAPFEAAMRAGGLGHLLPAARTACAPALDQVVAVLEAGRFDLTTEAATQLDIEGALLAEFAGLFLREFRLGARDRPDFFITGGIVVEVKHHRAAATPILRQLARYAAHPEVTAIVLATGRAIAAPAALEGKPLVQVNLGAGWL